MKGNYAKEKTKNLSFVKRLILMAIIVTMLAGDFILPVKLWSIAKEIEKQENSISANENETLSNNLNDEINSSDSNGKENENLTGAIESDENLSESTISEKNTNEEENAKEGTNTALEENLNEEQNNEDSANSKTHSLMMRSMPVGLLNTNNSLSLPQATASGVQIAEKTLEELAEKEHYYYSCGMRRSLSNFVKTQAEVYRRFIDKRHELKQKQENTSYNGYIVKHFDMNKVYMYTMHEYLKICEKSNDKELIKFYIDLIERYLKSDKDKSVSIITDENIKVDISSIIIRLENIKKRISDNSNLVEWVLIPEGRDYKRVKKNEKPSEDKMFIFNYEEIQRLRQLGEKKKTFYAGTPYIAKAVGLRKYRGYIAYIYANGKVILDREYNDDNPKSAVDNAAYIIEAKDFEELSREEKPELIKNPKASRKYHTDTFETRIKAIINKPGTEEQQEEAKQLVHRLKTRR